MYVIIIKMEKMKTDSSQHCTVCRHGQLLQLLPLPGQDLEVQEPGFHPGQDEGDDEQNVAQGVSAALPELPTNTNSLCHVSDEQNAAQGFWMLFPNYPAIQTLLMPCKG